MFPPDPLKVRRGYFLCLSRFYFLEIALSLMIYFESKLTT
nr:MAG TPA: hypothetical protein [Caudoviricetes sp.]